MSDRKPAGPNIADRPLIERLAYWEGEYHYPNGLLLEAANALKLLSERVRVAEGQVWGDIWQPISTAPVDGTLVDVWLGEADEDECEFYCGSRTYRRSTDWTYSQGRFRPHMGLHTALALPVVTVRPTHWMPRPEPPS